MLGVEEVLKTAAAGVGIAGYSGIYTLRIGQNFTRQEGTQEERRLPIVNKKLHYQDFENHDGCLTEMEVIYTAVNAPEVVPPGK